MKENIMKKKKNTVATPDLAEAFFREVSEDLQNDNLKAFWKKYGVQLVALVTICLTIAVSFETIKHWRDQHSQQWSDSFAYAQVLQNQGKLDDSLKLLAEIEKHGNDIFADEAQLETVNILFEQGKKTEAMAKLEKFVKSANVDKLKNIALIKLATYKIETATPDEMSKLLAPLAEDVKSPWQPEALELIALSYLQAGDEAKALVLYEDIVKNNDISDILRVRAKNMISVLTSGGENK